MPKPKNKEYGGEAPNAFHVHDVGFNPKISLGSWNVRLDNKLARDEQHKNWSKCDDALNHLEGVKHRVPNYESLKVKITALRDTYPKPSHLQDLEAGWSNESTVTGMTQQEFKAGFY